MTDKNGRMVRVGNKVLLPNGDVVRVKGKIEVRREVKMNQCQLVGKNTKLKRTNTPVVGELMYG